MADVLPGNSASNLTISTGTATVSGDIVMNGTGAENLINMTGAGTLYIGGNISATNGTLTAASSSTVNYNGASQNVRANTYGNLTLSGTNTKTQAGIILVNTNLNVAYGATLDVTGFNFTVNGSTTVGGTLTHSSATGTKTYTGNVTINNGGIWNDDADIIAVSFGGNLQNDGIINAGAGTHTFSNGSKTFSGTGVISIPNITISGSRTNSGTLSASTLTVNATLTNNGTITASTALAGSSTLTQGSGSVLNIGGTSTIFGLTATATSNTVNYTGAAQSVRATTYYHLNISGTTTAAGAITIKGNITIGSGASLDGSTFAHTVTGNWINNGGTYTGSGADTVTFNGTTQSIGGSSSTAFNNLTVNGAPSTTTLGADISVAGNLTLSTGDVLDLSTFSCNSTLAGGTFSLTSSSTLKLRGNNFPLNFTTNTLSGTVNYNSTAGGQTIYPGVTYATLTMGNTSGTQTAGGNIICTTLNNNTNAADILDMGTNTLTVTTINNTGTIQTQNTSATPLSSGRTWGGTVQFDGAAGQTLVGGTFNNILLSGTGPFTLAAAASLNVQGNWTKNSSGAFIPGTGTTTFNGAALQAIGGTDVTNFGKIVFNNTAGGINLVQTATVATSATFTSGIVNSTATNLLTFGAGATTGLSSNTSFVNGPVRKIFNSGETFSFPVGVTGTGDEPLTVDGISAAGYDFTAEYSRVSATSLSSSYNSPVQFVSGCEHWNLDKNAGPAAGVNVTLSWDANSGCNANPYVTNPGTLSIGVLNSGTWEEAGLAGTFSASTVTRTVVTSFGAFTLANVTGGSENSLPVMFNDVKAYEKDHGVQIDWTNLTERDLVNYVVERSVNGVNYTAISQQLPRSNNNDKQSYSAFDATPFSGANYYRIKVYEISGKVIYSKVARVEIGKISKGIMLYPNPVQGNQVSVSINATKGQYMIKVVNTAGQEIYSQEIVHQGGSLTQVVELPSAVKPGVYNIMISGDNYHETKMFLVQ
jgi:hypothetical protein